MRDAFGGVVNISMIVVFIALVSGLMAFNVTYTKAFRVKNRIIDLTEQYREKCMDSEECSSKAASYIQSIGYNSPTMDISRMVNSYPEYSAWECQNGYCIGEKRTVDVHDSSLESVQYKVVTQIIIDIPIINKIMPYLRFFQVSGDTNTLTED